MRPPEYSNHNPEDSQTKRIGNLQDRLTKIGVNFESLSNYSEKEITQAEKVVKILEEAYKVGGGKLVGSVLDLYFNKTQSDNFEEATESMLLAVKQAQNSQGKSRRNFIKNSAWVIGSLATGSAAHKVFEKPKNKLTTVESENTVELETPHALYRIVYSRHDTDHDPRIYENSDIIFIEELGLQPENFYGDKNQTEFEEYIKQYFKKGDLKSAYKYALAHNTSMFFVDSAFNVKGFEEAVSREIITAQKEKNVGNFLALGNLVHILTKRKVGNVNLAAGLLAAHLNSDELAKFSTIGKSDKFSQYGTSLHRAATAYRSTFRPETSENLLNIRNLVMAENAEAICKILSSQSGKKIAAVFPVGAYHTGLESALKMNPKRRLEKIIGRFSETEEQKALAKIIELRFRRMGPLSLIGSQRINNPNFE